MNIINNNNKYQEGVYSGFSPRCIYSSFLPNAVIFFLLCSFFILSHSVIAHNSFIFHNMKGWLLSSFIIYRVNIQCNSLIHILNTQVTHELEITMKVDKEDVLRCLGRHQDKSSEADLRYLLYINVTHSFQVLMVFICDILFFMSWWLFYCIVFGIVTGLCLKTS